MKSWWKRRRPHDCDVQAAERAEAEAKERGAQIARDWPAVRRASAGLRKEVERNHLTDLFVRSLGGHP